MPPTGTCKSALGSSQGEVIVANCYNKVSFKREYFMQITIILSNLVLANLLKFMSNISTLARSFIKVTATLAIWTQS